MRFAQLNPFLLATSALVGLAACGTNAASPDGRPTTIDAHSGGIDGAVQPDDANLTGATATVTVTALDPFHQAPISGAPVAFLDSDFGVDAEITTNADGVATAKVHPGGSVTILMPHSQPQEDEDSPELYTWIGVQDGDQLVINANTSVATAQTLSAVLSVPDAGPSDFYFTNGTCTDSAESSTTMLSVSFDSGCTPADVIVIAGDAENNFQSAFFTTATGLTDGGTVTLDGVFQPLATTTVSLSNVPTTATNITGQVDQLDGPIDLYSLSPQIAFTLGDDGTSATGTANLIDTTDLEVMSAISIPQTDSAGDMGSLLIVDRFNNGDDDGDAIQIDLATESLPTFATPPGYDVDGEKISWLESTGGSAATPNATSIKLQIDQGPSFYRWQLVSPHTTSSVAIPHLPQSLGGYNLTGQFGVEIVDVDIANYSTGYDIIRANRFAPLQTNDYVPAVGDRALIRSSGGILSTSGGGG